MAKTEAKTRVRRTDEQLIADLKQKIERLKRRAVERSARKDPALRHISAALRSIGKAEKESKDPATRQALDEARATLSACLSLNGAAPKAHNGTVRASARQSSVDATALLEHVRKHPGQGVDQIAAALGTDAVSMRPVMHGLIAASTVKTKGQRRGMSFHPV